MDEVVERIDKLLKHYESSHAEYTEMGDEDRARLCLSFMWDLRRLREKLVRT